MAEAFDSIGVDIGVFAGANHIPPHIWSTEEDISSARLVEMLHDLRAYNAARYIAAGIPGIAPTPL